MVKIENLEMIGMIFKSFYNLFVLVVSSVQWPHIQALHYLKTFSLQIFKYMNQPVYEF